MRDDQISFAGAVFFIVVLIGACVTIDWLGGPRHMRPHLYDPTDYGLGYQDARRDIELKQ